jgi:hypothetical protein
MPHRSVAIPRRKPLLVNARYTVFVIHHWLRDLNPNRDAGQEAPVHRFPLMFLLLSLTLTGAGHAHKHHGGSVSWTVSGWVIALREDAFAGTTRCIMRSDRPAMLYQRGAVGFVFPRHTDTSGALYRIDGGLALPWRDRLPDLIAAGAAIDGPALDDPTGGIVWLPEADVLAAHNIAIRPKPADIPRAFAVTGLAAAIASARARDCEFNPAHRR